MEHEAKQRAAVTRSQNAMYILPHDAASADEFLAPMLQRLDATSAGMQLIVIASDPDAVAIITTAAVRLADDLRIVPVASQRRAERRVREGAQVVVGTAGDLLALVRGAALKLDDVRAVVVAWADELSSPDVNALEALFSEMPKAGARAVVATEASDSVEALVERYARRPRRSTAGGEPGEAEPVSIGFVTAAMAGRAAALRRIVDALDPAAAAVYVSGDESARIAGQSIAAMGYRGTDAAVRIVQDGGTSDGADLLVLFDLPRAAESLATVAAGAKRTVAIVQPRQVAALRRLANGGSVTPVRLPEDSARGSNELTALRQALAAELAAGGIGRELLVLDPLLEDHDPIELAAAALRLVGRTGAPAAGGGAQNPSGAQDASGSAPAQMARVFINVGEMDNARPGDVVGAIVHEAGLQREQVGRVDLREKHAVVEVDASIVEQVIERLSGASIRGRRVQARLDQERPARSERPSRERSFDRDRGPRERSFDRDRPAGRSFDRDRPAGRSFDRDRPPRERPARGGADRGPRGGSERPSRPRPAGGRDDRGFGGPARGGGRPTRPRRDT